MNIPQIITETIHCIKCGQPFRAQFTVIDGKRFGIKRCQTCGDAEKNEIEKRASNAAKAKLDSEWAKICPETFQNTDPLHPRLNQTARAVAANWRAANAIRGLGLVGGTGEGKTRSLFYFALKAAHYAGRSCAAVSHARFSKLSIAAYSGNADQRTEAHGLIDWFHRAQVLLLDDLGKPPSTERADAELEDLIAHRTDHQKPILWTANGSGQWLIDRFGPDRGKPIVRRLADYCDVTTL